MVSPNLRRELPDQALYIDAFAWYERELNRRGGIYTDVYNRLQPTSKQSIHRARRLMADFTLNLSNHPYASQESLFQHRAYSAGFEQGVELGARIFKSDQFDVSTISVSMAHMLLNIHSQCENLHPQLIPGESSPGHYAHTFDHVVEEAFNQVGDSTVERINRWGAEAFPLHPTGQASYVLGHLATAVTVHAHQIAVNKHIDEEARSLR